MEYLNLKKDVQGMAEVICPRCDGIIKVSPTDLDNVINHSKKITCTKCTNLFLFTEDVLNNIDRANLDRITVDWKARNTTRVPGAKPNIVLKI